MATTKKATSLSNSGGSKKARVIGWLFLKVEDGKAVTSVEVEAANHVEAREKLPAGRYMLVTHCEVFDVE